MLVSAAAAQRRFFYGWDETVKNVPRRRYTFARPLTHQRQAARGWSDGRHAHGYPLAEQNLMRIMKEVSRCSTRTSTT